MGTFTGAKTVTGEAISFQAKKHGEQSYLISVPKIEAGEYAIIVNSSSNWNLFGVD